MAPIAIPYAAHMRAFTHPGFAAFYRCFVQFSQARCCSHCESLQLSKRDVWFTNVWMMVD
jgi:hypothetical protein